MNDKLIIAIGVLILLVNIAILFVVCRYGRKRFDIRRLKSISELIDESRFLLSVWSSLPDNEARKQVRERIIKNDFELKKMREKI